MASYEIDDKILPIIREALSGRVDALIKYLPHFATGKPDDKMLAVALDRITLIQEFLAQMKKKGV